MKKSLIPLLVAICALVLPRQARAGDDANGTLPGGGQGNGTLNDDKSKPEKPDVKADDSGKTEKELKPEKPSRPDDSGKPAEKAALANLKADFRVKAEEYQKQQKELLAKLKNATAEERGKVRDEIKELKQKFKDVREEIGEKLSELKPKIDRDAIDDARDHGRPRNK